MLTLYYAPRTCALAVHIALEDAGADYEARRIDFATGQQRSPEYLTSTRKAACRRWSRRAACSPRLRRCSSISRRPTRKRGSPRSTTPSRSRSSRAFASYLSSTVHVAHAHRPRGSALGRRARLAGRHEAQDARQHARQLPPHRARSVSRSLGFGRELFGSRPLSLHPRRLARRRTRSISRSFRSSPITTGACPSGRASSRRWPPRRPKRRPSPPDSGW